MATKKIANPEYEEKSKALKVLDSNVKKGEKKADMLRAALLEERSAVKALRSKLERMEAHLQECESEWNQVLEEMGSLYKGFDDARRELRDIQPTIEVD